MYWIVHVTTFPYFPSGVHSFPSICCLINRLRGDNNKLRKIYDCDQDLNKQRNG